MAIALPVLFLLAVGWRHRWVTDDAFINFRVVDNLAHGFGPVFNEGERIEVYTSTAWLVVLAVANVLGLPLEWTSVVLGLGLTAFGLAAGSWGAVLLARTSGRIGTAVPLGALIVVALRPMWDFATSGLEMGLGFAWLGGTFWALVAALRGPPGSDAPRGRVARLAASPAALAVTIGLGPLIRPDFGIFSVGFLVMLVAIARPRWARVAALVALAAALPLAYQIFRMGYFAQMVPNTAVAKEADLAYWSRGWAYLKDFVGPYALWIPIVALAAILPVDARAAWRRSDRQAAVLTIVPVVAGLLHCLYVVRVGGDFMHGRLLLPGLFAGLLPVMVATVPASWRSLRFAGAAIVVGWSVVCVAALHLPRDDPRRVQRIQDERAFYAAFTGNPHPVDVEDHSNGDFARDGRRLRDRLGGGRILLLGSVRQPLVRERGYPDVPGTRSTPHEVIGGLLAVGVAGYVAGPEVRIVDRFGLADPVAARLRFRPIETFVGVTWQPRYRAGHEKVLPQEWVIARFADLDSPEGRDLAAMPSVAAARRALDCGDMRRLLDAVQEPISAGRFLSNIRTAWQLRDFRISPEPERAASEVCGA